MFANVLVTVVRRAGACAAPLRRMYTTRRFVDGAPGSLTSQSLTDNELRDFARDGFVLRRKMFDASETSLLQQAARSDKLLEDNTFSIADGEGGKNDLTLWRHPGDDIYGMVMRCARLVRSAEAILQEEVYHYQTKLMRKDPETGGAFPWHQDYGWWYADGILRPKLVTAFLAVDPCTVENGALQVIKGSHELGRLSHGLVGGQQGVGDMQRVTAIRKTMKTEFMEMEPGDVVFLDSNLLHRSKANRSTVPRWALLVSYNAVSNVPYKVKDGAYDKLQVVPDSSVKKIGVKRASDPSLFAKSADTAPDADAEAGSK